VFEVRREGDEDFIFTLLPNPEVHIISGAEIRKKEIAAILGPGRLYLESFARRKCHTAKRYKEQNGYSDYFHGFPPFAIFC